MIIKNWSDPLNSERNELVFENRNKSYGAYIIRKSYSNTLMIATLGACLLLFTSISPFLTHSSKSSNKEVVLANEQIVISQDLKEELPEPPVEPIVPERKPQVETTKFIETEMVDEQVNNEIKTQSELQDTKVGTVDQKGDDNIIIPEEHDSKFNVVEEPKQEPFIVVEEMPTFQGGDGAMMKWIQSQVRYPEYEKEADISGKVFVRFVIQSDGSVDNVKVVRGVSKGLDKEAIRVISSMPKWIPGKQGGHAVPVYFNLPISFVLN